MCVTHPTNDVIHSIETQGEQQDMLNDDGRMHGEGEGEGGGMEIEGEEEGDRAVDGMEGAGWCLCVIYSYVCDFCW